MPTVDLTLIRVDENMLNMVYWLKGFICGSTAVSLFRK